MKKVKSSNTRLPKPESKSVTATSKFRYKREMVRHLERKKLMQELAEKLGKPGFLKTLETICPESIADIFLYRFNGTGVVIKDMGDRRMHGGEYMTFRKVFLTHHKEARKGGIDAKNYILKAPKVYGTINANNTVYLIMEYMKETEAKKFVKHYYKARGESAGIHLTDSKSKSFGYAFYKLQKNFNGLNRKGKIKLLPQVFHVMPLGNTNPKHPEKGRWIFSLPYDYS